MPGPLPKAAATRQRRNRAATRSVMHLVPGGVPEPSLPERDVEHPWHELTLAWWHDVWASPMAGEYLDADRHGLFILADLVDRYWHTPRPELAAEIRLQRRDFGLTPLDRRRLQWEVERVEEALDKRRPRDTAARRSTKTVLEALR